MRPPTSVRRADLKVWGVDRWLQRAYHPVTAGNDGSCRGIGLDPRSGGVRVTAPYFATTSSASMDAAGSEWREMCSILDQLPDLAGPPFEVQALPGGLTNRNYRVVSHDRRKVVVRISAEHGPLLQIDREAEHRNAVAASRAGVGPDVVGYLAERGVLVIDWIDGRTLSSTDLDDTANLERIAATCRRLHEGPRFANDFDMFTVQRRYQFGALVVRASGDAESAGLIQAAREARSGPRPGRRVPPDKPDAHMCLDQAHRPFGVS